MLQRPIFREKSLERLMTPEQLDQLMPIVSAKNWLALAGLIGLVIVGVFWALTSTLPVTVTGQGMLLRGGAVYQTQTPLTGQIAALLVQAGDFVEQGQTVAYLTAVGQSEPVIITAPHEGVVMELRAAVGDVVQAGDSLFTVEPNAPLEAVIYLPAAAGRQVQPGMTVRLTPATVSAQDGGYLLGEIKSVSPFPATPQGMARLLGSETLAQTLAADQTVLEARVALLRSGDNPDAYLWSSVRAQPVELQGGTLTAVQVILREVRPFELLFGG